jgi:hypothetical protein
MVDSDFSRDWGPISKAKAPGVKFNPALVADGSFSTLLALRNRERLTGEVGHKGIFLASFTRQ